MYAKLQQVLQSFSFIYAWTVLSVPDIASVQYIEHMSLYRPYSTRQISRDAEEPYRHSTLGDAAVMTVAASTVVMLEMPAVECK